MPKKYIRCMVFHPQKGNSIPVDIEIDVKEEIIQENNREVIHSVIITPIFNEFLTAGLDSTFPAFMIYDICQQSDYVGTIDEIIHRILNESGGDF